MSYIIVYLPTASVVIDGVSRLSKYPYRSEVIIPRFTNKKEAEEYLKDMNFGPTSIPSSGYEVFGSFIAFGERDIPKHLFEIVEER